MKLSELPVQRLAAGGPEHAVPDVRFHRPGIGARSELDSRVVHHQPLFGDYHFRGYSVAVGDDVFEGQPLHHIHARAGGLPLRDRCVQRIRRHP